ncbi:MAG: hypothetical protein WDO06_06510 [Actinomycetota bacterium]
MRLIGHLADQARRAARTLSIASGLERQAALLAIADEIENREADILAANLKDMALCARPMICIPNFKIGYYLTILEFSEWQMVRDK